MGSIDLRGTEFEGLVLYSPSKQISWWEEWWQFRYDRNDIYCASRFKDLHELILDTIAGRTNVSIMQMSPGTLLAALWVQAEAMGVATEYEAIMDDKPYRTRPT